MAKNKTINMVKSQVIYKDYSKDAERTALVSGENLSHMFGKIARWYTDISWVGHTHTEANITDFGTYAGASTKGGAATSANKLNIGSADIGSETKPVYFSYLTGKPVACTYSLNASVPANAVFTDINVKQSPSTADESREVLFAGNTGNTETNGTVGKSNKLYFNPSTGALTATSFSGSMAASNLTGSIDAARLPNSGVTANSYGPAAGGTLTYGGTFDVPYVTVDKYGRLTAGSTKTFTMPVQYTHPTYTSKTSGLYKITVDSTGHVSGTAAVAASDLPAHTHDYLPTTTKYAISDSVGGCAISSFSNHLKYGNEMNISKLASTGHVWFGYRWDTDGTTENGKDIDRYITKYIFGNCAGDGSKAQVEASAFIGNASSADIPYGFSSRATSASWTVGGTFVTGWDAGNGCEIAFVKDYPASKQLSCCIDGYFFQNEGKKRVLDEANYSSYVTPAGIGALSTSTKYALSETVGGPAIAATAIKLSHGNEVNFSKLGSGYEDIFFGWRWREADGSESSDANAGLNCYHFLKGNGTNSYAAIKASEFKGIATSAYRLTDTAITIKTGSSNQSHISMETLINWLVSRGVIPNNINVSIVIPVGWSYANNDILQASINGTNYEIQLAGVIIEFHGYVNTSTDYLSGVYRFRIHTSPAKSFTPASGYTQFPTSSIAEFFCNGSGYSPTWKMFASTSETSNYVLKAGDTMTGTLKVQENLWVYLSGNNYGAILRSDGSNFYILLTNQNSPTGTWNSKRPLYINFSSGLVNLHEGIDVIGGLTYRESNDAILKVVSENRTSSGIEFTRSGDNYTDFRVLNNAGTFRIQCDYTNAHVDWFDVLNISNNIGNMSVKGAGTFGGNIYATGGTMSGNLKITETKNLMLRTTDSGNYFAGIGYDTSGNECIALWASNTVTRLRWYAGTNMSSLPAGTMMNITPDFEVSKAGGEPWAYVGGLPLDLYKTSLQVDNRENFASYPWHKFAEITTNYSYGDFGITFLFTQTYNDLRNSGILSAKLRTGGDCLYQGATLEWHLANPNIVLENFVLVYINNSSNSTCKVELWCKQTARYNGYFFKVLRETRRTSRTPYDWTVFNSTDTGSATYTSGTGTVTSTLMNILNPAAKLSVGNVGSNIQPVYFSGGSPVACKQASSGAYFSIVPFVRSDGVMDIGRYIDFHTTNASTTVNYRIDQWTVDSIEFNSRGTNNRVNIYTPGEGWTQLSFQVNATNKAFTASGIRVRPLTASGTIMQIECSGNMVIGSGESPSTLYSNSYDNLDTTETERLYLASDSEIYFITNAQTYAGVKNLMIDTSGNIRLGSAQALVQLQNSTSNFTEAIVWWKGGTAPGNYGPSIGQHNVGDTDGSICILPYNTSTSPWGGNVGLFVSKTRLLFNGTAISLNGHTHSYLPLSGGTMTGTIVGKGAGGTWISARANASLTQPTMSNSSSYYPVFSAKTKLGEWSTGTLGPDSEHLYFSYTTDANYSAGSNKNSSVYINTSGWFSGTAAKADVWTNSRTITIGSTGKSVDGSGNVSWSLSEIGAASSSHTHTYLIDPGNSSYKIEVAWAGESVPTTATSYPAVYTTHNKSSSVTYRIKEMTWSNFGTMLGLKSAAFTESSAYAASSHNHTDKLGAKSDGTYYGMASPTLADNVWIRTTTLGIIPYESGGLGSGHGGIGTSSWHFSYMHCDTYNGATLKLGSSSVRGLIEIQGATSGSVSYGSSNPRIRFKNSDSSQNIDIVMNDWDSVRAPASLSVHGNQGGEYLLAPNVAAWDYTNNKWTALLRTFTEGTTSTVGDGRLIAGNGTAKGTAGNAKGIVEIYSEQTGCVFLVAPTSLTSSYTVTLPSSAGTLELVGHTHSYLPLSGGTLTGNLSLTETKSILLRPNHSSYTAGIGYDTSGNECIGIWAKNTVTRLRWHAGTDMTTMTSGTMMGITPDFEISKASGTAKGYIAGDSIVTYKILWSGSTSCTARSSTDITLTTSIAANKYRFIKIIWNVSGATGVSEIRADTLNVINNVSSASGATTANIIQFTISSDGKKLTVGPGTTTITVIQIAGVCVI